MLYYIYCNCITDNLLTYTCTGIYHNGLCTSSSYVMQNNQGTPNLSFNGYLYRMKNNNGEHIYWRCTVKDCPATINTWNNIPTAFGRRPHNHLSNQAKIDAKQIINTIQIEQNPKLRPKLYDEEICKLRTQDWNDDTKTQLNNYQHFFL